MESLQLDHAPVAKAEMLIRKPAAEVFEAFVNPAVTTKFWFTRSSGKLEAGKNVQWDWEMYKVSAEISVKSLEPSKRIVIEWTAYGGPTTIEFLFTAYGDKATFVSISETGFGGDADTIVKQAMSSTEGFTLVLAGLKALLEHNTRLNLVADRFPGGLEEGSEEAASEVAGAE
jgi:uncharacterized protein YndB with AHSA1/START domain